MENITGMPTCARKYCAVMFIFISMMVWYLYIIAKNTQNTQSVEDSDRGSGITDNSNSTINNNNNNDNNSSEDNDNSGNNNDSDSDIASTLSLSSLPLLSLLSLFLIVLLLLSVIPLPRSLSSTDCVFFAFFCDHMQVPYHHRNENKHDSTIFPCTCWHSCNVFHK